MGSVVTQLNAALGTSANLQFSNPSGSTLRVLDDGAPNRSDVTAASVTDDDVVAHQRQSRSFRCSPTTACSIPARSPPTVRSRPALAGRISVNSALLGDPSRTIVYSTNPLTAAGDTTRSDFILTQLTTGSYRYSPQTGIGTTGAPFTGIAAEFRQAGHQPARRSRELRQAAGGRPGRRAEHLAEQDECNVGRQYRRRDGASAGAAERLFRQRTRHVVTVKHMYDALLQAM